MYVSHISVYSVSAVRLTPSGLRLAADILAQILRAKGYEVEVVAEGAVVRDYYGNETSVDVALVGRGDVALERGIGLSLAGDGTPKLIADFWRSGLKWIKDDVRDVFVAADYAAAVQSVDPSFQIAEIEYRGERIAVSAGGGDFWW